MTADKSQTRFYELDFLRFGAALLVVFYHYTFRGYAADNLSPLSFPHLAALFQYGYLGVDLFFLISGFVILMSALTKNNATDFVLSRIQRLYPAFWAGVTLTALTSVCIGGEKFQVHLGQYLANLTMVSGYFGVKPVDDVYWSLLVELKFYFLIFLLLLLNGLGKMTYFLGAWAGVTLGVSFCGAPAIVNFFLFPEWSPYFIAGALLYLIHREGPSLDKLGILFVVYALSLKSACLYRVGLAAHYHTPFSAVIIIGLISSFYLLLFCIAWGKTTWLRRKEALSLGALSYPLYLVHQKMGFMLFNTSAAVINKYLLLAGAVSLMLLIAYGINNYVEQKVARPLKRVLAAVVTFLPHGWRVLATPAIRLGLVLSPGVISGRRPAASLLAYHIRRLWRLEPRR